MSRKPKKKSKQLPTAKPTPKASPEQLKEEIASRRAAGSLEKALSACERLLELEPGGPAQQLWRETAFQHMGELVAGHRHGAALKLAKSLREAGGSGVELELLEARARVGAGGWSPLLEELGQPDIDLARQRVLEEVIRQDLTDLAVLTGSATQHPLRQAAEKLAVAFAQVTSGPVSQLDLPELSRRSPLAGWRLLIQAIASFYNGADEQAQRLLAAIAAGSAALKGAAILTAAMQGQDKPALAGALLGVTAGLREGLAELDRLAAWSYDERKLCSKIEKVIGLLRTSAPEKLPLFRQRLSIKLSVHQCQTDRIARLLVPMETRSSFWREWGLAYQDGDPELFPLAAAGLEEYRLQARAEGLLSPIQEAAVLVRIAEMTPPSEYFDSEEKKELAGLIRQVYQTQTASIRSVSPLGGKGKLPTDYLDPHRCFQRACALDPEPETFAAWLAWESQIPSGHPENAALAWHKQRPQDLEPLKMLVDHHERRGASAQAQSFLEKALLIDRLNPEVAMAQLRLALANSRRLLKSGKLHLLDAHLRILEGSELMKQDGYSAILSALHALLFHQQRKPDLPRKAFEKTVERMGSQAVAMLLLSSLGESRANDLISDLKLAWKDTPDDVRALPLLSRLGRELRLELRVPGNWYEKWRKAVGGRVGASLDIGQLCEICDLGLRARSPELAFTASGVALKRKGGPVARALFYRAHAIIDGEDQDRLEEVVAVAHHLAALEGDEATRGQTADLARARGFDLREIDVDQELVDDVLKEERGARKRPRAKAPDEPCNCPDCMAARLGIDPDEALDGMPPDLLDELVSMFMKQVKKKKPSGKRKARV